MRDIGEGDSTVSPSAQAATVRLRASPSIMTEIFLSGDIRSNVFAETDAAVAATKRRPNKRLMVTDMIDSGESGLIMFSERDAQPHNCRMDTPDTVGQIVA